MKRNIDRTIVARVMKSGSFRPGKGFSLGEIRNAGLDLREALKLGIPLDRRRKTIHDRNVKMLCSRFSTCS